MGFGLVVENNLMKPYSLLLLSLATMVLSAASCDKRTDEVPDCSAVLCTMEFRSISVKVTDNNNAPVVLDDHYTENVSTGAIIRPENGTTVGTYVVYSDAGLKTLINQTATFRFVGMKNGNVVVDERYTISGDCCHINKVSGKDTIVIP